MVYRLVYGLFYAVSLLPAFMLYGLGDVIKFLLHRVFGYRKEVVMGNLAIAFPEKTMEERKKIASAFYRNFVDTFIETLMLFSASGRRLDKMFVGDLRLLDDLGAKNLKIQVNTMHQFNWELLSLIGPRKLNVLLTIVYMPLSNQVMDKVFRKLRSRFGTELISASNFKRDFLKYSDKSYVMALVADQSPGSPKNAFWVRFFGKPTAFVTGPEKGAVISKSAVVFANIIKLKRGVYTAKFELITEDAGLLPPGEITIRYARFAEKSIREQPANYLWSHRRWKYDYKDEYAESALEPMSEKEFRQIDSEISSKSV